VHICVHDERGIIAKRFKIGTRILLSASFVFIKLARLASGSVTRKLNDDSLPSNPWEHFHHNAGTRTISSQWLLDQSTPDLALERE
jgi:hypothetical protein